MGSNGHLRQLIANSVFALFGAAMMFGLAYYASIEPPDDTERESAAEVDRLAYISPGAMDPRERFSHGVGSIGEPAPDSDNAREADWSTEARNAARQPEARSRFGLRLPWQSQPPATAPTGPRRYYTLKARLDELRPAASARLAQRFEAAKAPWPPAEIVLIAIKDERALDLHARQAGGAFKLVHRYRVLAASGRNGPKLRQGDKQVPEGVYAISFLNPNSAFHVSLRVNYPNAFDRKMAAKDGRRDLGGDIMIHGKNLSAGCLAVGDEAAEELFVLAAETGLKNVRLIIAPTDLRQKAPLLEAGQPQWLPGLYGEIKSAMAAFEAPPRVESPAPSLLSLITSSTQ